MRDEAHIGFVDAHAECDSGDDDDAVIALEALLIRRARRRIHTGVIWQRGDAVLDQPVRGFFHFLARLAIHDAGLSRMRIEKIGELPPRVVLLDDAITNIRPIET